MFCYTTDHIFDLFEASTLRHFHANIRGHPHMNYMKQQNVNLKNNKIETA